MKERIDSYERELRDPALTALLRETFADDPALQEAPGRTEHIMRRVMMSGVRPQRRGFRWDAFAWVTGAMATTAAALAILVGTMNPIHHEVIANDPPKDTTPLIEHTASSVETPDPPFNNTETAETPNVVIPKVVEAPRPRWEPVPEKHAIAPKPAPRAPETPAVMPDEVAVAAESAPGNPVHVAATLYSAGSAAQAAGDYHTAYEAYQASYDTMPTPDALLASSRALQHMAQQDLATETEG